MRDKEELELLLKECDKEKLHLCGHVQPFGALLGLQKDNFLITYVSENSELFLHVEPKSLLNHFLHEVCLPLQLLVEAFLKNPPKEKFSYHRATCRFQKSTLNLRLLEV